MNEEPYGTVTPIDTATNTADKNIKVGVDPGPIVLAPDGKTLYAAGNTTLTPIDTATRTARPAIRVAPRNGFDITTTITPQEVVPVNVATNTAGRPIGTGLQPTGIAITGGHQSLFAAR